MIYVLDTDILSLLGHQDSPEAPRIRRHIAELPEADSVVTTIINFEEQMRGWMAALSRAKSAKAEVAIYARLLQHLKNFGLIDVLGYDEHAAAITVELRGQRLSVGTMDLKIAAITLACEGILITRNVTDFRGIKGLRIEDWSSDENLG